MQPVAQRRILPIDMTLGAGALARLLVLADAAILHVPALLMVGSLALVVLLAARQARLACVEGTILLLAYPVFIAWVLLA